MFDTLLAPFFLGENRGDGLIQARCFQGQAGDRAKITSLGSGETFAAVFRELNGQLLAAERKYGWIRIHVQNVAERGGAVKLILLTVAAVSVAPSSLVFRRDGWSPCRPRAK
jgi:hypothetical protein